MVAAITPLANMQSLIYTDNAPIYYPLRSSNEIILFIEAYHSGGAFTLDRVNEIKRMCRAGTKVAFITAFETTKKMLQVYTAVVWDTEMWTADEPTHLVHKNGDKFIGREI